MANLALPTPALQQADGPPLLLADAENQRAPSLYRAQTHPLLCRPGLLVLEVSWSSRIVGSAFLQPVVVPTQVIPWASSPSLDFDHSCPHGFGLWRS